MADNQPTEVVETEQNIPTPSVVSYIPDELKNDPFVRSIARQCDYLKEDVDRVRGQLDSERASHKETRTGLWDALERGMAQAVELEKANAVIRDRNQRRTLDISPSLYWLIAVAIVMVVGTVQTLASYGVFQ